MQKLQINQVKTRAARKSELIDTAPYELQTRNQIKTSIETTNSDRSVISGSLKVSQSAHNEAHGTSLLFPFGFSPAEIPDQSEEASALKNDLTPPQSGQRRTALNKGNYEMAFKEAIDRQENYVKRISNEGFDFGVTIAKAFINSIRDLGYKDPGTALNELVDNSIESEAQEIHVATQTDANKKVTSIAIIDDGHGMIPSMARASLVWGGTDREGSRNGFGRYGYGLPSASVSQGRSYSVYTRIDSGNFYRVGMDLDELESDKYLQNNRVVVPEPEIESLPKWVESYIVESFKGGLETVRTVIVWDNLDRLSWKKSDIFDARVKENLGINYRNFIHWHKIYVNGKILEPLDPLFTTAGARFFDFDYEQAESIPGMKLNIPDSDGVYHEVKVRLSYMSPTFFSVDKSRPAQGKNANPRFAIRKKNNGFIVCRNGRQIDVVKSNDITTFQNNDRHIGIELDFPAALDELFGVTTAKQQITVSDAVWDHLKAAGFDRALAELRNRCKKEKNEATITKEKEEGSNPSEELVKENSKFIRRKPLTDEAAVQAKLNRENRIRQKAKETGLDEETLRKSYLVENSTGSFEVRHESISGNVFYSIKQEGGTVVLTYNENHPFYENLYAIGSGSEATRFRTGIDLLLYSMGIQELDGNNEIKTFYTAEKIGWTDKLSILMPRIDDYLISSPIDDQQSAEELLA